jgi:hypothetical protein
MEQISQFFGSNINEVILLCLSWLNPDEIFAFFVIIFTQKLQKLESSSVCGNAKLVVKVLVS